MSQMTVSTGTETQASASSSKTTAMRRVPVGPPERLAGVAHNHIDVDVGVGFLVTKDAASRTQDGGPAAEFASVGVDDLRSLDDASRRLLVNGS